MTTETFTDEIARRVERRVEAMEPGMRAPAEDMLAAYPLGTETRSPRLLAARLGLSDSDRSAWHNLSPEAIESLLDLGYRTSDEVERAATLLSASRWEVRALVGSGMTARRAEVLSGLDNHHDLVNALGRSAWVRESLTSEQVADEDVVAAWSVPRDQRYVALLGLLDPARGERAHHFKQVGRDYISWVESDVPLETLQALVKVLPATQRVASETRAVAVGKAGFTAMDVKEFGATLCQTPFTPDHLTALRESGVSTKVIRALHAALHYDPDRALEVYPALAREGITTTATARSMRKFVAGTEKDWGYIAARVPTGDLEQWTHTLRTPTERDRHLITRQDADDIADLAHRGVDHDSLVTLARASRGESNRHADRPDAARPLAWFVDLVHAGVDAERSALLARCGIPTSRQALHAQDADPWAAGATYREQYESEERRQAESWGAIHGPARTWAFTRDEALAGPQPAVSA